MADDKWHETTGVNPDTVRVPLLVEKETRETWSKEAEKAGYPSRTKYLRDLIQEARAYRQEGFLSHHQSQQRIQELENQVGELERQLEEKNDSTGSTGSGLLIDDPEFIEEFLTTEYQPLHDILQNIVQSGELVPLIRRQIENQLYTLASQNRVEFQRGHGWKTLQRNRGEH